MPALGRDSLVGMLLAYAALTLGVCVVSRAASCTPAPAPAGAGTAADETALWAFLGHVAPGMSLGTWSIVQVTPPRGGALVVTLRPAGGTDLELAVTRLVPDGPRPLARTASLAVFLAGPGPAGAITPPESLEAAAALAAALAAREAIRPPPLAPLTP